MRGTRRDTITRVARLLHATGDVRPVYALLAAVLGVVGLPGQGCLDRPACQDQVGYLLSGVCDPSDGTADVADSELGLDGDTTSAEVDTELALDGDATIVEVDAQDSGGPGPNDPCAAVVLVHTEASYLLAPACPGASWQSLDAAIPGLPGPPDQLGVDSELGWYWYVTEEECGAGASCLGLATYGAPTGSGAELLLDINGDSLEVREDVPAATRDGETVVFTGVSGGLHASHRDGQRWTAPTVLTAASPFDHHGYPSFTSDGLSVVFSCWSGDLYVDSDESTVHVCQVGLDGNGFELRVRAGDDPVSDPTAGDTAVPGEQQPVIHDSSSAARLVNPSVVPGTTDVVFHAEFPDATIVYRHPAGEAASAVNNQYKGDRFPCALPDGRIASVNRDELDDGKQGVKVMNGDGAEVFFLPDPVGVEAWQILGLTCGAP